MDQLAPSLIASSNSKADKAVKKKAASFFHKFSSQKSIEQDRSYDSLKQGRRPAVTENQNLTQFLANVSVPDPLDNQYHKSIETNVIISQSRQQRTGYQPSTKVQSTNPVILTTVASASLPLCQRKTSKLYQLGQINQTPGSISDGNSKNNGTKYPTISLSRKQPSPLLVKKSHISSSSTPFKLYTTLDAITEGSQPCIKNKMDQCAEYCYIHANQSKDSLNRQGNLVPVKESSQLYSRGISPSFEKDPQSPDSKYPDSTTSSICYRSDEDEAITPSESHSTQWPLTGGNKNRYYKSRRSKSHGDYLITIMDPETNTDALYTPGPSFTTSSYCSQDESDHTNLDRSISISSLASTCSSSISRSNNNISQLSSLSSKSIFGKSDFQKKESKAIAMWHSTVQNLIIQRKAALSLKNQPAKPKNTEKNQAVARFIINELYSTEKSYYHFLTCIYSNYMEPMQIASQLKTPLVKSNDVHVLFYHLPDLISMSEKLLYNLEMYIELDSRDATVKCPGEAIGRIFKDLEQELVVFLKYAIHYQGHMKSIRRASTTGYVLNIDRTRRREHSNYNRLGLADYLIAPFQRVPRYELLLKDLLKHTTNSGMNNDDLIYAMDTVNGLAATMNMVQEKITTSLFSVSFYSNLYTQSSTNLALQQTF